MHVTIYENELKENEKIKKIILTEEQYLILCDYILKSFTQKQDESFILLEGYHYNSINDNFYEAEGSYDLFNTCNNWANSALKAAGVQVTTHQYANTQHGFNNDTTPRFDAPAAKLSWDRTLAFFKANLG